MALVVCTLYVGGQGEALNLQTDGYQSRAVRLTYTSSSHTLLLSSMNHLARSESFGLVSRFLESDSFPLGLF